MLRRPILELASSQQGKYEEEKKNRTRGGRESGVL
jgi:hypothetical protein